MSLECARIVARGAVQGLGFRPFVYRLATELGLHGWVQNSPQGVEIEVEGEGESVRECVRRLSLEKPPHAVLQSLESSRQELSGHRSFEIRASDERGAKSAFILPDLAPCPECVREIFDPRNRRYRYPFTNCTHCGPRFSIIEALPYDRTHTSMKEFAMCPDCRREYDDPRDRRFHAQPNACPRCGPQLELWSAEGEVCAFARDALFAAAQIIREGRIVALKGVGGFQLLVDVRNDPAVRRLRAGKHREEKPFAIMVPSLAAARALCEVSTEEEELLLSQAAPIVLLRSRSESSVAAAVAPGNPYLGLMLPSSPLHHLLLRELHFPVVATSGNRSDEPICIDEGEALERLRGIAELFLVHDRPIVRHVDDSVVRLLGGRPAVLRRARGYAPLPVRLTADAPAILALGAHLKNTVALSSGANVFLSQHLGDLSTPQAHAAFRQSAADLPRLYDAAPAMVACDLHPDYLSTKFAAGLGAPVHPVQHHHAHILSCLAENGLEPPALGVAWDGTGYGSDGTAWGGEFLRVGGAGFERVAHLRTFPLPGGDAAAREPRRAALGVLWEIFGPAALGHDALAPVQAFSAFELRVAEQMLAKEVHSPRTSSIGRLFDAVASIIGLRQRGSFEGQAAMELEFAICPETDAAYPFQLTAGSPRVLNWEPMIRALLDDVRRGEPVGVISAKFHGWLAGVVTAVAQAVGEPRVVLSGGCFQNARLLESCIQALRADGFEPCWHQHVPPNDGGIALGQIVAAALAHPAPELSYVPRHPR